jgi:hypothetical protein
MTITGTMTVGYGSLYGVFDTTETAAREVLDLERGLIEGRRAETGR